MHGLKWEQDKCKCRKRTFVDLLSFDSCLLENQNFISLWVLLDFPLIFFCSSVALKQDDRLLIIRCYFYSIFGNESTDKKIFFCYFFVFVNHRQIFWKGFIYLFHEGVESAALRFLWIITWNQALVPILVKPHLTLHRKNDGEESVGVPRRKESTFKKSLLISFFIYLTFHPWENL